MQSSRLESGLNALLSVIVFCPAWLLHTWSVAFPRKHPLFDAQDGGSPWNSSPHKNTYSNSTMEAMVVPPIAKRANLQCIFPSLWWMLCSPRSYGTIVPSTEKKGKNKRWLVWPCIAADIYFISSGIHIPDEMIKCNNRARYQTKYSITWHPCMEFEWKRHPFCQGGWLYRALLST